MAWSLGPFLTFGPVPDGLPHIGMLREKPLHASLKSWYAQAGDHVEQPVDGFVIDLVRDGLLIEVQTVGLSAMRPKLESLLDLGHRLRIVHSIPVDRWIVKMGEGGEVVSRRRSPKHGQVHDVFAELVGMPDLLLDDGLEVELLSTVEEEYRHHTPGKSWRRGGWSVKERRLIEVVGSTLLSSVSDLVALLPEGLPDRFTTLDLANQLGRPRRLAQQMAYCLREMGALTRVGKRGRSVEYELA